MRGRANKACLHETHTPCGEQGSYPSSFNATRDDLHSEKDESQPSNTALLCMRQLQECDSNAPHISSLSFGGGSNRSPKLGMVSNGVSKYDMPKSEVVLNIPSSVSNTMTGYLLRKSSQLVSLVG